MKVVFQDGAQLWKVNLKLPCTQAEVCSAWCGVLVLYSFFQSSVVPSAVIHRHEPWFKVTVSLIIIVIIIIIIIKLL